MGGTIQHNFNNIQTVLGLGYNSDASLRNILAASSLMTAVSVANTYKYAAIFSRLNYIWRNKYIVNLTARRDGSSRFGRKNPNK